MIRNKRVLITGGAGSIGSELAKQLFSHNKVFLLDLDETGTYDFIEEYKQQGYWIHGRIGDIRDEDTVEDVFSDFKPEIIFHAAAYKHITPMEWAPIEAIQTNVMGTYNVLKYAKKWECVEKFVFISTDKAVQSHSIMGATKRLGEIMVKNQGKGYMVVRFANVLGSRGSVIPIWQKQINEGRALTITDPQMSRYFMTIEQACSLVIEAAEMGKGGEIFVIDLGKPVNILELAKEIIAKSGKEVPIKFIGVRPGELLSEKLMFDEERLVAKKINNFWVIR
jgi:FlaA1/EpsC-like NDP-sugar epimerase